MKEVFEYILSLFKSRIFPLILVFAILVGVLINRLFGLQIINGESYVKDLSSSILLRQREIHILMIFLLYMKTDSMYSI